MVREKVQPLKESLSKLPHNEEFFYQIRQKNPKELNPVERASRFIYLNKTCYNGLYRVNSRGLFNVPFGRYKNPLICDGRNLDLCSATLSKANLTHQSYEKILDKAEKGDLIYFDPPYFPISKSSSFSSYEKSGFNGADHENLRDLFLALHRKHCFVVLSNSFTPFTAKLFQGLDKAIKVKIVHANRSINSVGTSRGIIQEILVRNF